MEVVFENFDCRTSTGKVHTVSPTGRPANAFAGSGWSYMVTPITGRVAWDQRVRGNQPDRAERRGRPDGRLIELQNTGAIR